LLRVVSWLERPAWPAASRFSGIGEVCGGEKGGKHGRKETQVAPLEGSVGIPRLGGGSDASARPATRPGASQRHRPVGLV